MRLQRLDLRSTRLRSTRLARPSVQRRTFVQGGLGLVSGALLGGASDTLDIFAMPAPHQ